MIHDLVQTFPTSIEMFFFLGFLLGISIPHYYEHHVLENDRIKELLLPVKTSTNPPVEDKDTMSTILYKN